MRGSVEIILVLERHPGLTGWDLSDKEIEAEEEEEQNQILLCVLIGVGSLIMQNHTNIT